MKPRDIFLSALTRKKTPRPATGSATSIVTTDLMKKVGVSFPDAHLDPRTMSDLAGAGFTELGFDNVMPLYSVWHESEAIGCEVDWGAPDRMPDSRGRIWKIEDDIRPPKDFLSKRGCRVPIESLTMLKKRIGSDCAIVGKVFGPWTLGYHVFGVDEFLINTLLNPDAVRRAMDALKEVTVAFAKAQVDAGADALCFADHATRDLCSPDAYRDFLIETHREMVERVPCPLILHICGDTSDRIGHIRKTGMPCFHFDSKVPAAKARELAGEKLSLMGGTSNFTVVRSGTLDDVRRDVAEKVKIGIDIIGPECAVPLDAPCRNLKAIADEVKKLAAASP